jgi:predicted ATPase/Tfp pilus assembly protein PilF
VGLEEFRLKVESYYKNIGQTQKNLALQLGFDRRQFAEKLKGRRYSPFTPTQIKEIIKVLAEWEAITSREQAVELLALSNLTETSFKAEEWLKPPLTRLELTNSLNRKNEHSSEILIKRQARTVVNKIPSKNLFHFPVVQASFIGREKELKEIQGLLETKSLVTLTGPAGVGKTRLALEVGQSLQTKFLGGIFFINFAAIKDPILIASTLVQYLGLFEMAGQNLAEKVKTYFQENEILLILDNFEHLIAGAPILVELIGRISKTRLLVTSRERLQVSEEKVFDLRPLRVTDLRLIAQKKVDQETVLQLQGNPAISLFVDRSLRVNEDFCLNKESLKTVAQICWKLDGLPLAIELAASRTRVLSLTDLQEQLKVPLAILKFRKAKETNQYQSLRDAINWSYQLLGEVDKFVFRQLGIFAGGCQFETFKALINEIVKNSNPSLKLREEELLDSLESLLDKNLIVILQDKDSRFRYGMLETIREYALEQLKEIGEWDITSIHHIFYYLELAELSIKGLKGNNQREWLNRLEVESLNLEATLERSIAQGQIEYSLRLGIALTSFWVMQSHFIKGQHWLEQLIGTPTSTDYYSIQLAICQLCLGKMYIRQGLLDQGLRCLDSAQPVLENNGEKAELALTLSERAYVFLQKGDFQPAQTLLEESLAIYLDLDMELEVGEIESNLGACSYRLGNIKIAHHYFESSLKISRRYGNKWRDAKNLGNLGAVNLVLRNFATARQQLEASLELFLELEDKDGVEKSSTQLGELFFAEGNYEQALKQFEEVLGMESARNNKSMEALLLNKLGMVRYCLGDYEKAYQIYQQGLKITRRCGYQDIQSSLLNNLGFLLLKNAGYKQSKDHFLEALEISLKAGSSYKQGMSLIGLGCLCNFTGQEEMAVKLISGGQNLANQSRGIEIGYEPFYFEIIKNLEAKLENERFKLLWQEGIYNPINNLIDLVYNHAEYF